MTLRDRDILNLPEAPPQLSEPPRYTAAEFIALCEKMLPYWNRERFSKPPAPFVGEPFRLIEEADPQQKD